MTKLPYKEGDWIGVPIAEGQYALGILARVPKGGRKLLGYFMATPFTVLPTTDELEHFRPTDAVLVAMFGDLGLLKEGWKVIGRSQKWDRSMWPMPAFAHTDVVSGRTSKRLYSDDGENRFVGEQPCLAKECDALPVDGVLGAGALQRVLMKRLSKDEK